MSSPEKLYDPHELTGISDEDKEVLNREIKHHVDTDPVVRAIMIAHQGVHERSANDPDPVVRAIKYAQEGMRRHLKDKLQPLYERMRSGRRA
jgi:hypothetical protein